MAQALSRFFEEYGRDFPGVYLETNGTLAAELKSLAPWVGVISMDWKLASAAKLDGRQVADRHREFLRAAKGKELFVFIFSL